MPVFSDRFVFPAICAGAKWEQQSGFCYKAGVPGRDGFAVQFHL